MKKIKIGEHCFGPIVDVDDINITEDNEQARLIRKDILNEIASISDSINPYDWQSLLHILVQYKRYECKVEESYSDPCDQCGNYNHSDTYYKVTE